MAHTSYSPSQWRLEETIPYLLSYYFKKRPTSNKELREAFWKLMGKDIKDSSGILRWTSTNRGVPSQIHLLTKEKKILEIYPEDIADNEYKQYSYSYVLGNNAEKYIRKFIKSYDENIINAEIHKYLGIPTDISNTDIQNNFIPKKAEKYLPTKQDYENFKKEFDEVNKTDEVYMDEFLDFMQKKLDGQDKVLKENWRRITEKNIEIWTKN